jgi:hypothetical protein
MEVLSGDRAAHEYTSFSSVLMELTLSCCAIGGFDGGFFYGVQA